MKKFILGFISTLLLLAMIFCITVLIMASVNNRTFTGEIKSWSSKQEKVVTDDNKSQISYDRISLNNF